jgi:Sema domain
MMTRPRVVPLLFLLQVCLGQVVRVVHLDTPNNTTTDLTHLVVDGQSGRVYVAGLNRLYQLTSDLLVERSVVTGPQDDSIYCSARGSCQQGAEKVPTDNFNKALLVDAVEKVLLACGSLYQGVCEKYVLEDISKKWPTIQVPLVSSNKKKRY